MLDTTSLNQPIKIQYKYPKFLRQRIRTLGTSVIDSLMSPPPLCKKIMKTKTNPSVD